MADSSANPVTLVAELAKAAMELAQYASYAEIVGGVSVNRSAVREWSDKIFALNYKFETALDQAAVPATSEDGAFLSNMERFLVSGSGGNGSPMSNGECLRRVETLQSALTRAEIERDEALGEAAMLQDILDSRPAINAGLPDTYVRWSQSIYSGDIVRAALKPDGAVE